MSWFYQTNNQLSFCCYSQWSHFTSSSHPTKITLTTKKATKIGKRKARWFADWSHTTFVSTSMTTEKFMKRRIFLKNNARNQTTDLLFDNYFFYEITYLNWLFCSIDSPFQSLLAKIVLQYYMLHEIFLQFSCMVKYSKLLYQIWAIDNVIRWCESNCIVF